MKYKLTKKENEMFMEFNMLPTEALLEINAIVSIILQDRNK